MRTKGKPSAKLAEVEPASEAEGPAEVEISRTRPPFKLDIVFVTSSEKAAEEFRLHVMANYKPGRVPVGISPVRNTGDAKSGAHVFHLSLPHATDDFVESLPRLVADCDGVMWLEYPDEWDRLHVYFNRVGDEKPLEVV